MNYNDFKINLFNAYIEENKIKIKMGNRDVNVPNLTYLGSTYVELNSIIKLLDRKIIFNFDKNEVKILQ